MSIILSGLIHVFQPLLSSLSGALDCEGLGPWYFLLGLRIVAIFFSNGPWDTSKEDVACNWVHPIHDRSRDFCTAMCHNQHFPISVSSTWALVFIVLLLLVGLMRLSTPQKKKDDHKDDKEKNSLAIVATAPHRSSADISTIYHVGSRGLTRSYGSNSFRPPDSTWSDWYGPRVAYGPGEPIPDIEYGPGEVGGYGGYGMPVNSSPVGETGMPEQGYNMAHSKARACRMDRKQTTSSRNCAGTDQYEMSTVHHQMRQPNVAPPYDETAQYIPTSCSSLPDYSSYKGYVSPQCWAGGEHNETIQQRYTDPEECGICKSPDSSGSASMYRYTGQSEMEPKYWKGSGDSMANKCRAGIKRNMDSLAVPRWEDGKANMAIKRRPVNGNKMPTKRCVTFNATASGEMAFGSNMSSQPCPAENSSMPDHDVCAETDPCCRETRCGPQCEPSGGGETTPSSDNTSPTESTPGPQDKAKMTIARICGIPLFDLWVGLILATEIGFLLAIILLQMPRLVGRTFICTPVVASCPQSVECAVRGRAEKRVALWGLAFTSILFLIGCSAYFNLRMCGSNRCRRKRAKKEEREEASATDTEPEGRVCRGDVEGGNGDAGGGL